MDPSWLVLFLARLAGEKKIGREKTTKDIFLGVGAGPERVAGGACLSSVRKARVLGVSWGGVRSRHKLHGGSGAEWRTGACRRSVLLADFSGPRVVKDV